MSRICWVVILALVSAGTAGCAGGDATDAGDGSGRITVAAASSLTDAFTELGEQFEQTHPGMTVQFSFAASSTLARQITEGAPASVFASADQATMDSIGDAGLLAGRSRTFARNQLTLISQPGLDSPITAVEDLRSARVVALCAVTAPCGVLSGEVLDRAGIELPASRVSRAPNARATLRAVSNGDAQGALVYVTDALVAADAVVTTPLPTPLRVTTPYSIAVLDNQPRPKVARAFVTFLQTPQAAKTLIRHGFMAP